MYTPNFVFSDGVVNRQAVCVDAADRLVSAAIELVLAGVPLVLRGFALIVQTLCKGLLWVIIEVLFWVDDLVSGLPDVWAEIKTCLIIAGIKGRCMRIKLMRKLGKLIDEFVHELAVLWEMRSELIDEQRGEE